MGLEMSFYGCRVVILWVQRCQFVGLEMSFLGVEMSFCGSRDVILEMSFCGSRDVIL